MVVAVSSYDGIRSVAIVFEILVVGAALRLGWVGWCRRSWSDVIRSVALAMYALAAAKMTEQRLGQPGVSWPVVVELVASAGAIAGFLMAEILRRRRGE